MIIKTFLVYYVARRSIRQLSIHYWWIGRYPLSYTVQECVESYCELVGWNFLSLDTEGDDMEKYSLRVEIPVSENISNTLRTNVYDTRV